MSAYAAMKRINDKYNQGWDADIMLDLACDYIDNQESDDSYEDYLLEAVVISDKEKEE